MEPNSPDQYWMPQPGDSAVIDLGPAWKNTLLAVDLTAYQELTKAGKNGDGKAFDKLLQTGRVHRVPSGTSVSIVASSDGLPVVEDPYIELRLKLPNGKETHGFIPRYHVTMNGKRPLQAKNLRHTAFHEAGHAVLAIALNLELKSVDIQDLVLPNGLHAGGKTIVERPAPIYFMREKEALAIPHAASMIAGFFAEKRINPRADQERGYLLDVPDALRIIAWAVCEIIDPGNDPYKISEEAAKRGSPECQAIYKQAEALAERLVEENWTAIERVADLLIKETKLSGDEVAEAVRNLMTSG